MVANDIRMTARRDSAPLPPRIRNHQKKQGERSEVRLSARQMNVICPPRDLTCPTSIFRQNHEWQTLPGQKWVLTSVEAAADGSDDDLECKETAHSVEDIPVLLVDSMNADDMDDGAGRKKDGRADRLE